MENRQFTNTENEADNRSDADCKNMERSKKYRDWLIKRLKDHDEAVAYLNTALEESLKGE